ncbi:hypothetical protein [Rhizobium rhizogenes]|uniref:hypothetical protein n=1 Tax=Rhizobium rhizogenes TaxID=359 RepID=UPI001FEF7C1F|nr:hypothetical protein [Rhizobium rhizogenes]
MDVEISDANVNEALEWLLKLNGKQHTLLSLEREDGWRIMVGGGPIRYVVILGNGDDNLTLENPRGKQSTIIELCAGGQFGDYSETVCVGPERAVNAVSLFFEGREQEEQWGGDVFGPGRVRK